MCFFIQAAVAAATAHLSSPKHTSILANSTATATASHSHMRDVGTSIGAASIVSPGAGAGAGAGAASPARDKPMARSTTGSVASIAQVDAGTGAGAEEGPADMHERHSSYSFYPKVKVGYVRMASPSALLGDLMGPLKEAGALPSHTRSTAAGAAASFFSDVSNTELDATTSTARSFTSLSSSAGAADAGRGSAGSRSEGVGRLEEVERALSEARSHLQQLLLGLQEHSQGLMGMPVLEEEEDSTIGGEESEQEEEEVLTREGHGEGGPAPSTPSSTGRERVAAAAAAAASVSKSGKRRNHVRQSVAVRSGGSVRGTAATSTHQEYAESLGAVTARMMASLDQTLAALRTTRISSPAPSHTHTASPPSSTVKPMSLVFDDIPPLPKATPDAAASSADEDNSLVQGASRAASAAASAAVAGRPFASVPAPASMAAQDVESSTSSSVQDSHVFIAHSSAPSDDRSHVHDDDYSRRTTASPEDRTVINAAASLRVATISATTATTHITAGTTRTTTTTTSSATNRKASPAPTSGHTSTDSTASSHGGTTPWPWSQVLQQALQAGDRRVSGDSNVSGGSHALLGSAQDQHAQQVAGIRGASSFAASFARPTSSPRSASMSPSACGAEAQGLEGVAVVERRRTTAEGHRAGLGGNNGAGAQVTPVSRLSVSQV